MSDVRCNQCGWQGIEDELIATLCADDGEPCRGCPNCRTDGHLIDVEQDRVHHRITIRRADLPWPAYTWHDDASDGGGHAETIEEARRQIDAHLRKANA